jgi:MFS family permease
MTVAALRQRLEAIYRSYDTAIWIRVLGTALTSVTNFMLRPYLVLYLHDRLEGSVLLPMLIVGLPPLCGMLVNLYGGTLSDRYGRKPVMLASLWIQALCMLGYLLAADVWQYALAASCMGLGNAMFMPAANAQVADVVPPERRAKVFALLHTALNIGAAAGPLLGLIMFAWRPSVVFLICAASTLLYSVLVWLKVPETRPERNAHEAFGTALASDVAYQAGGSSRPASAHAARRPRLRKLGWNEHKTLYLITLCSLMMNLLYAQVETTLPLHLQTRFADFKSVFAMMLTFNGFVVITLQMWIAGKSEALPSYAVMGAAFALYALVALGYGFAPWLWLLLATELLFTLGEMLYGPHVQKVVSAIAPIDKRGWYFSVFGMNWQLSRAAGPVLGGVAFRAFGGEAMFLMLSVVIAVAGAIIFFVVRKATNIHAKAPFVHAPRRQESVIAEQ